jgi:hypothetical protein
VSGSVGQDRLMGADTLTRRELNRATLARQLLLERASVPVVDAVTHLVGLQAQEPPNPYTALWSRLAGFAPDELAQALVDRRVVRTHVMRATLHLVTADDCLLLRPLTQPVLEAELRRHRDFAPALEGVDLSSPLAFGRSVLEERPRNNRELRVAFAERFPDHDAAALAYACRCLLPLVQVPPRGVWGQNSEVRVTTAESWLGRPLAVAPSLDEVVLRYIGAFGPASVADVTTWSRLTGLRDVVERLRPQLREFRDENGRVLFDLPDAARPDADTLAPPRFLPEYDNVLLSHADRTRFISDERRSKLWTASGPIRGSVLHDGLWVATWRTEHDRDTGATTLVMDHPEAIPRAAKAAIAAEGEAMLRFAAPDSTAHRLRFVRARD